MRTVLATRTIDLEQTQLWNILDDFGGIYRFHPAVERSPLLGRQRSGLGARRRCEFYDGSQVVEEIIDYQPGQQLTVDIVEGSLPLEQAQGTIALAPLQDGGTEVSFRIDYKPKYGPLGAVMDALVMRRSFRKLLARVLEGLETHARTGAVIGKDGIEQAA